MIHAESVADHSRRKVQRQLVLGLDVSVIDLWLKVRVKVRVSIRIRVRDILGTKLLDTIRLWHEMSGSLEIDQELTELHSNLDFHVLSRTVY